MIRVYSSFAQRRPSRPSTRSRPNRQRGTTVPPILFKKKKRQTSRQAFQGGLKVPKCFVPNKNNQGLKTWPTLWTVIICAHKKIRNGAKIRTLQTQWNPSIVMPDGCTTHKRFEKIPPRSDVTPFSGGLRDQLFSPFDIQRQQQKRTDSSRPFKYPVSP